MRKTMTKEVTKTTVKAVTMTKDEQGKPQTVELPDEILLGNVSQEKALKELRKKHDNPNIMVYETIPDTTVYEMPVEEFIQYAKVKEEEEEQETVTQ